jgi:hypothetical protein
MPAFCPLDDRLKSKLVTNPTTGCLEFSGALDDNGYGRIWRGGGSTRYAHRIAWELAFGAIPDDLCVLHRCDNPCCCNPAHLFLGTIADNNADMKDKGRYVGGGVKGELNPHVKLTAEQVRAMRVRRQNGETIASIARSVGLSAWGASCAITGRKWKHL